MTNSKFTGKAYIKRHLHTGFGEPNVADPCGMIRIVETSFLREDGEPRTKIYWTGWRPRLAVWIINLLIPPVRDWTGLPKGSWARSK